MNIKLILLLSSITLAFANQQLGFTISGDKQHISLFVQDQVMVIGYQAQQDIKDFIFCYYEDCQCKDMLSNGRVHPSENPIQLVSNVQCADNHITFDRVDNHLKPYIWDNPYTKRRVLASPATYTDTDLTGSIVVDTTFTLKWLVNSDNTIDVAMIFGKKSWFGLGLAPGMNNVDMWVVQVGTDNSLTLTDCYATGDSSPPTDTQQDLTIVSYEVADTGIKIRLKRKLDTGDTKDKVLASGSSYKFVYAYSNSLSMQQHTSTKQFDVTLNTKAQTAPASESILYIMMLIVLLTLL